MPQGIHPMRLYVGQGCQGLVTRIEDDGEVLCDIGAEEVARIPARLLGQGAAMRDLTWKTSWMIHLGYHIIRVNYNDLTATSLEIMVSKGNHPQMALIQVSEIL